MGNGFVDDRVDQPHQRVVRFTHYIGIGRLAVGGRVVQVLCQFLRCGACGERWARAVFGSTRDDFSPGRIRGIAWVNAVGLGDGRSQGTRRSFDGNQPPLGQKAQLAEQHPVVRVGHEQRQGFVAHQQGQHRFALGHGAGHQGQGVRLWLQVGGVDHVLAQPGGNHLPQLVLAEVMLLHQDLANRACVPFVPFLLLGLQAAGQCRRCDQPGRQQRLPQMAGLAKGRVWRRKQHPQSIRALRLDALKHRGIGVFGVGHGRGSERELVFHSDGRVV